MTPLEHERLNQVCILMQAEKDEDTLSTLFKELNQLLEKKEQQFAEDTKRDPLLRFGY